MKPGLLVTQQSQTIKKTLSSTSTDNRLPKIKEILPLFTLFTGNIHSYTTSIKTKCKKTVLASRPLGLFK